MLTKCFANTHMTERRKTLYENIHALRKKPATSRVGLHYADENDEYIMKEAANGTSIEEIAKVQRRTPRAIQTRIIMNAIKLMQLRNLSLQDVSNMYNVKITLLSRHYQRVCEREREITKLIRDTCMGKATKQE